MAKVAEVSSRRRGKTGPSKRRAPFECVALLLQGGGSLGAYQGGVYQALAEADLHPNWVAGISVGAINAAIVAGNPPEKRVEQLHAFWDRVTANPFGRWADPWFMDDAALAGIGDIAHGFLDQFRALQALVAGAPDFFKPRFPPPWMSAPGSPEATSFYDTAALKTTLESLVDFDRINSKAMRFSVGAVNVRTGNFVYFDSETHTIRPEHILASGALPPGFPAIEIDGEYYWDGGLVSNTPLQWVVDAEPRRDMLAFQVDLWSSRGAFPQDMSRSRDPAEGNSILEPDPCEHRQAQAHAKNPARLCTSFLRGCARRYFLRPSRPSCLPSLPTQGLQHRAIDLPIKALRGNSKDYEFSRLSMGEHWRAGHTDAVQTLRHKEIFDAAQ